MTLRIERYKHTRHWALYDGADLVVVTVYRRGAQEVQRRLAAQPRAAPARAPANGHSPLPRHPPSDRVWRAGRGGRSEAPSWPTVLGNVKELRLARLS